MDLNLDFLKDLKSICPHKKVICSICGKVINECACKDVEKKIEKSKCSTCKELTRK
jgi:hypothetical protein